MVLLLKAAASARICYIKERAREHEKQHLNCFIIEEATEQQRRFIGCCATHQEAVTRNQGSIEPTSLKILLVRRGKDRALQWKSRNNNI